MTKRKPSGYWTGKQGLENAKKEVLAFFGKKGKNPTTRTKGFQSIARCVTKGNWKEYKIYTWNDLLKFCGLTPSRISNKWIGREGLELAIKEIEEYYAKEKKVPRMNNVSSGIFGACQRGYWKEYGINSWNDLLRYCNLKPTYTSGKWKRLEGLEKAKQIILEFYQKHNRSPTVKEIPYGDSIRKAAERGYWEKYNIESWNSLLVFCGLEVNVRMNIWKEKQGLENAKKELREFLEREGRIPVSKEVSAGILTQIRLINWEKYGVRTWNDLLKYSGLEANYLWGKWVGLEGLEEAKKIILQKYKELGRVPTIKDVSGGLSGAAGKGYWVEFGINNWNDLLRYCGLKPNLEIGKWMGKEGFENAKSLIIEAYKRDGKPPSRGEFQGINDAIARGEWKEYGFHGTTYTDFIIHCGLKPNLGYLSDVWLKWENWCEKAIRIIYPQRFKTKPKLPNGTFPDFVVKLARNEVLIVDAKLDSFTERIDKDIKNYVDYCNRLEFWCLFRQRTSKVFKNREIIFLNPEKILNRVKVSNQREKLSNRLKDLYEYSRKEFSEVPFSKTIKDKYQKTLDYWLEDN